MAYNILAISGSLRKGSINTALLRAYQERASEGVSIELADISPIQLYNADIEDVGIPLEVTALKDKIKAADGIIIATPEYNRTIPGVLSNVMDWTSRPTGDNAWVGKPVYVVGATGGSIGTSLAQADLKKMLVYLNAHLMGQPEFYLGGAMKKFDENGKLTDEGTLKFIDSGLIAFIAYIDIFRK